MLVSSWLGLLRSDARLTSPYRRPDRPSDRRNPWRNATTAFRDNPFRPPSPMRAPRGTRQRPSEIRWIARQRQV